MTEKISARMDSGPSISDLLRNDAPRDARSSFRLNSKLINRSTAHPEVIFENSSKIVTTKRSSLGDDSWTVIEQLVIAAIKLGRGPWIGYGLRLLRDKFPNSARVTKLAGLYKESKEDWEEAETLYKGMLAENATDLYPRKRMIACLKAQGRIADCIGAILDQIEVFSSDPELWHELSMLYARQCAFSKAVSAFEEVLLSNPTSFYNLVVYAELLASAGNWSAARKYYCKALQYRPDETRALWGLLNSLISAPIKDGKAQAAMLNSTKQRLIAVYEPHKHTNAAKLVISMVNSV
jgi:tetratricopeptide (TPR) repeat protein